MTTEERQTDAFSMNQAPVLRNEIRLKRQATVKTIVTDAFRSRAKDEFGREVVLVKQQIESLEQSYTQTMKQLEDLAKNGQHVETQMTQLNQEAQAKKHQLVTLQDEVSNRLNNLEQVENGALVTTGMLESYVSLQLGDNIYAKVRNTEIIVKDGVVTEIRE